MPTLKIKTNIEIPSERRSALLKAASSAVAELLHKPEAYVMVMLETCPDMLFAGTSEPLAYLELKSLGLPEDRTTELSAGICDFLQRSLGIAPARIYIELASPPHHLFGWNSGTF